jgi:hypothetical protein
MWLKKVVPVRRRRGHNAPHGLLTIADAIVPDGWHTTGAALVEFTGIFLPPHLFWDVTWKYAFLVPLLAGFDRCPPEYGNNDVNLLLHHLELVTYSMNRSDNPNQPIIKPCSQRCRQVSQDILLLEQILGTETSLALSKNCVCQPYRLESPGLSKPLIPRLSLHLLG